MKLPSQSPMNYKTRKGLFDATCRALAAPPSARRSFWIQGAVWWAGEAMPDLLPQLSRVIDESSPRTLDQLIPIGYSSPCCFA